MQRLPDFAELCELEPRLRDMERHVDSIRDDGSGSFFCSNFLWLPLNATLRELVGVARSGPDPDPLLRDSRAYELAYVHLSRRMPPCRGCGCRLFAPWREAELSGG